MWGEDCAGGVEQVAESVGQVFEVEAVAGHVFVLYDIEGGTEHVSVVECADQAGGVHYGTTGGVDEVEGMAETLDKGVVDHVAGLGCKGYVEAEDLGTFL